VSWLKDILCFFFLFSHKSKLFAIFVDWPLERKLKLEILAVIFVLWRQSRVAKRQSAQRKWVIELQNGRPGGSWQVALTWLTGRQPHEGPVDARTRRFVR